MKVSEQGQEHNLLSEIQEDRNIDGGYVEKSAWESFARWMRSDEPIEQQEEEQKFTHVMIQDRSDVK